MAKYKATAYIRLSYAGDRTSESDSVGNQRRLIESFIAKTPEIELVAEKIDDGYSGILFDRPSFKEMMQDIADGKINCVIVKDLSRLGREYIETGRYLRRVFPAYGVRFIAIFIKRLYRFMGPQNAARRRSRQECRSILFLPRHRRGDGVSRRHKKVLTFLSRNSIIQSKTCSGFRNSPGDSSGLSPH